MDSRFSEYTDNSREYKTVRDTSDVSGGDVQNSLSDADEQVRDLPEDAAGEAFLMADTRETVRDLPEDTDTDTSEKEDPRFVVRDLPEDTH